MRNLPQDADPWDEANWRFPNPALGSFLSIEALRDEAREAKANPVKENAFRQFRLNQWVQQTTRWMPMHLWDGLASTSGEIDDRRPVWGGLDLSSVSDLTSLCWLSHEEGQPVRLVWRHWVPEAVIPRLDDFTAGAASVWVRDGWLRITDGDVVDYDAVHEQIAADCQRWSVQALGIDRWNSTATTNWLQSNVRRLKVEQVAQGYSGMSGPLKTIMRYVRLGELNHGGDPVARWCFDSVQVRQDDAENIRPVKPDRGRERARIDAVASASMAVAEWMAHPTVKRKARSAGF
jgi:hypothetical protein